MSGAASFCPQQVVMNSLQPTAADSDTIGGNLWFEMKQRNFIGRHVASRRKQNGWTQDVFTDHLQQAGWDKATRSTVSKIEDGSLRIDLTQFFYLAKALRIHPIRLLPKMDWSRPVRPQIYPQP